MRCHLLSSYGSAIEETELPLVSRLAKLGQEIQYGRSIIISDTGLIGKVEAGSKEAIVGMF